MDLGLRAKTCVVTGASRGIGLATARGLAAEGASVLLVSRDADALERAVSEVGGRSAAMSIDVTAPGAGEAVVGECVNRFGAIDALVNNAGTSAVRSLEELTEEEWRAQWDLHVMAPLALMRAAAPRMAERGEGRIVNVCSSSGKRPSLTNAAYSVSKAAQLSLSRVFAQTYADTGVAVNAVAPGPAETPLWMDPGGLADQTAAAQGISRDEVLEAARARVPRGRFGTEDEIAAVVVFLCSPVVANVIGAAWSVDGGAVPVII
jgi:3-oxoacyl-[acyl-carrier protein] reductase